MNRYDHTQTRQAAIRSVLDAMLEPLDKLGYKRILPAVVDVTKVRELTLMYGVMPRYGASTRVHSDLGRGHYDWTDHIGIEAVFPVPTDEHQKLEREGSVAVHEIERAIERYRDNGTALIDNEEITIYLKKVDLNSQNINIVVAKDRVSVLVRGTITTGVAWKPQ